MISFTPLEITLLKRGMTKKALRAGAGVSVSTWNRMMRGENITLEIVERICKYLDVPIEEVVEILPDDSAKND